MFNSCLYECEVQHKRNTPTRHNIKHRTFLFLLDLDDTDSLKRASRLIGHNSFNVFAFYESDHLQESLGNSNSLQAQITEFVRRTEPELSSKISSVQLLTGLRFLNYVFSPLSVFYCFDQAGSAICAVVEVCNTFHERKVYLVSNKHERENKSNNNNNNNNNNNQSVLFKSDQPKDFYVSPFISLDSNFHFAISNAEERVTLAVNSIINNVPQLTASLVGVRRELTTTNLLKALAKDPLASFGIIFFIHFNALLLWLKKVPFIQKKDNPELQRDLVRQMKSSKGA